MKYLVIWFWLQTFMIPCPQSAPIPDKFGRVSEITISTLQICWDTNIIQQEQYFKTLKEAQDFIVEGEKEGDLVDFELKVINNPNP